MKRIVLAALILALAVPAWGAKKQQQNKLPPNPCPDGIATYYRDLVLLNPFDNTGKCYAMYDSRALLVIDKNTAIYGSNTPFAIVTFKDKSAPLYFGGVVKGLGAYQYKNAFGGLVTVHRLVALSAYDFKIIKMHKDIEDQKARAASDAKVKAEEEAYQKARAVSDAKVKAEEEVLQKEQAKKAERIRKCLENPRLYICAPEKVGGGIYYYDNKNEQE